MSGLKVVTLHESNFRDPAATLRVIAGQIESGEYTNVSTVGIAMISDEGLSVFGLGPHAEASQVSLLFSAAIARFANEVLEYHGSNDQE